MAVNQDIQWGLDELARRDPAYKLYEDYLDGQHRLDFVPADFRREFAALLKSARLNMCPAVVNAVRDRLKLTGLTASADDKEIASEIGAVWRENRMDALAGRVHRSALTCGDSFVIVGENRRGGVTLYPNRARVVAARYDEDVPTEISFAAKFWMLDDKRVRCTLYYPDRIEKYVTASKTSGGQLNAKVFVPLPSEFEDESPVMLNVYDQVPIFHFSCESELKDAISIQDALNKTVRDMLIGGESHALPQRWATGVQASVDSKTGKPVNDWIPGDFWTTQNQDARFGQLDAANIEQFQKVKEGYKADMATVTGIPVFYFNPGTGTPPSGESLKTQEFRLSSRVGEHQTNFGDAWEAVFKFALKIRGNGDVELDGVWKDTTPRNEKEYQEMVIQRYDKLDLSKRQAFKELNYTDEEIKRMATERADERAAGDDTGLVGIARRIAEAGGSPNPLQ